MTPRCACTACQRAGPPTARAALAEYRYHDNERYIRVMCDYEADGVWDWHGTGCEPEHFGLPPEICARLRAWQLTYEKADGFEGVPPARHVAEAWLRMPEFHAFVAEGLAIARAIKAHVGPDWRVDYHDQGMAIEGRRIPFRDADRPTFEYEVDAAPAPCHCGYADPSLHLPTCALHPLRQRVAEIVDARRTS